jgi:membrane protease YdiL (CAAX protease family)
MSTPSLHRRGLSKARGVGTSVGIILASYVISIVLLVMVGFKSVSPPVSAAITSTGFVLGAAVYLYGFRSGGSYLDVEALSRRDVGLALGVAALLVVWQASILIGLELIGAQTPQTTPGSSQRTMLLMIPISILLVGPAEELTFRNVIQKRLGESFSTLTAIAITSVLFTLLHFSAFLGGGVLGGVGIAFTVLGSAVILGVTYERTGNILVAMIAHGVFDVFTFAWKLLVL